MKTRIVCLSALTIAISACSSMPARNAALDQAREHYQSASADPQVVALAPTELQHASQSLQTAEQAQTNRDKAVIVDHLAQMADRRVVIARETASSRAAQTVTDDAAGQRDRVRLQARTNEADAAHQQVASLQDQLSELNAKKTDRGIVVTLGDVLFNTGQSQLSAAGNDNLTKLADVMRRNPQSRASIEGYTDSVGSAASNQLLSERRAMAVQTALQDQGVTADRLSVQGHGEDSPVAGNGTASGRQMNRRVEIVFAPQDNAVSTN
ncbi:MAG TPA: OmpA family protein [Rhodanobacter sp.]